MSIIDGAKVRWREWREAAEARKAAQVSDPPNVTVPAWLVRAAYFASWVATCSLIYFLWLYTLDIARDRSGQLHITRAGTWEGDVSFWWPYIVGFAIVAFGIPYVAKIAVPTFMSLSWRGNFWPKLWALIIAVAVSLVVIAGTFAVQGDTLMERDRDAVVAVEQVQNGRAAIQAQIDGINEDLRAAGANPNRTMAQAASVGMLAGSAEAAAAEWTRSYVQAAEAANAPNVELLRRATGAARAAGAAVERREQLRIQLAQAPAIASVQGQVITERTGWIAATINWLEGVRAILLSLVMDIVALMMPWIALRLEQARNRQMGLAEGIERHPWMIEHKPEAGMKANDLARQRAKDVMEAMVAGGADPRFAADMARSAAEPGTIKEELFDGETGEKLIYRKSTWAKPPKKREKTKMNVPAEDRGPREDERGVQTDGGGRIAMSAAGPIELPAAKSAPEANADEVQVREPDGGERQENEQPSSEAVTGDEQPEPPELSDEEALALADELAAEEVQQQPDEAPAQPEPEARVEQADEDADQRERPETNPGRMIAAE